MTSKPSPSHECESWQIRRHPSGGRYCAACGALQVRPPIPGPDVRPAVDGGEEELQSLTGYRGDPAAFVEEALQIELAPWQRATVRRLLDPDGAARKPAT